MALTKAYETAMLRSGMTDAQKNSLTKQFGIDISATGIFPTIVPKKEGE